MKKNQQLVPLMCREHPRCRSAGSLRGQGREESIRHGAGDAAGGAALLNNPFGEKKKPTQKTRREGPVIYLALPQKVLATSRSYSEEFRINPAAKGGRQVGCDKASDHGQVSHDAAGVVFCSSTSMTVFPGESQESPLATPDAIPEGWGEQHPRLPGMQLRINPDGWE